MKKYVCDVCGWVYFKAYFCEQIGWTKEVFLNGENQNKEAVAPAPAKE